MARVVVGELTLQAERLGVWFGREDQGLELLGRMTVEKTVSSPVLYLSGTCRIGTDPSHGSLHSWRQDISVCSVGFLEFKAIPMTLRIKSDIMGMPALSHSVNVRLM